MGYSWCGRSVTSTGQSSMKFSVTEMQNFTRCPQKWDLTSFNRQGLEPIMKAPALALGTLWHKTKEDWSNALYMDGLAPSEVDPVAIYTAHANEMIGNLIVNYREALGANPGGAEMLGVTQARILGEAMVRNYWRYWGEPIDSKRFNLVKAEQVLMVPIPHTLHIECSSPQCAIQCICAKGYGDGASGDLHPCCKREYHYLEGTLDGLMTHKETGAYYILENKTFGAHPNIEELSRNFQFGCYVWLARQFFQGADVRGIAYDGIWKRADLPRLKLKASAPEGTVPEPRMYKKTGKPYTWDDMFLRTTLMRGQTELQKLEAMLALTANRMASYPPAPVLERVVPPVKGCVLDDKSNIRLCDAIWRGEFTTLIMQGFQKRERTEAFRDDDLDPLDAGED